MAFGCTGRMAMHPNMELFQGSDKSTQQDDLTP
jgi:hypothetical protein